eukprot:5981481-Amphidinium_carterae.1
MGKSFHFRRTGHRMQNPMMCQQCHLQFHTKKLCGGSLGAGCRGEGGSQLSTLHHHVLQLKKRGAPGSTPPQEGLSSKSRRKIWGVLRPPFLWGRNQIERLPVL